MAMKIRLAESHEGRVVESSGPVWPSQERRFGNQTNIVLMFLPLELEAV